MTEPDDDKSFMNGYCDGEYDGFTNAPNDDDDAFTAEFPESYRAGYAEGYKDGRGKREQLPH